MSKTHLGKVLFLVALLTVGSQANPIRGRKSSFGMGLLGGALMGGVVGHAVARHSAPKAASAPPSAPLAQVVENGVPDAHGCYKQTIKEPVAGHGKLYTETVHLVCPNGSPPSHPQQVVVPAQVVPGFHPAVPVHHVVNTSGHAPASNHSQILKTSSSNATHIQTVLLHPGATAGAAPGAVPAVIYASAPAGVAHHPPPAGPPRVVLLSKTVKKQKSAAASLNVSHGLLILIVLFCILRK